MNRPCVLLFMIMFLLPSVAFAQKVGVLPFEDASEVGPEFGEQVTKFIRSEFLRNKKITPKFTQYTPKEEEDPAIIDLERAVELRRKNGVDYVIIGTILEAEATSSSSGIDRITVLGQSVGSSVRAVTATITIQGDLVSVKNGKLVESIRTTGNRTESSVGADVSTEWGSVNSDSSADNNTPNAKALRDAVEKLVKEITAML